MERMRRKNEIIKGNKYGDSFHSTLKSLWEIKDIEMPKTETKNKKQPFKLFLSSKILLPFNISCAA